MVRDLSRSLFLLPYFLPLIYCFTVVWIPVYLFCGICRPEEITREGKVVLCGCAGEVWNGVWRNSRSCGENFPVFRRLVKRPEMRRRWVAGDFLRFQIAFVSQSISDFRSRHFSCWFKGYIGDSSKPTFMAALIITTYSLLLIYYIWGYFFSRLLEILYPSWYKAVVFRHPDSMREYTGPYSGKTIKLYVNKVNPPEIIEKAIEIQQEFHEMYHYLHQKRSPKR